MTKKQKPKKKLTLKKRSVRALNEKELSAANGGYYRSQICAGTAECEPPDEYNTGACAPKPPSAVCADTWGGLARTGG